MEGRLKYKIVSCSSEDKDHPISNLLVRGSSGWESGRFCSYPQEITLQFYSPVHVKQLQFMSNCRKIARRIDILYYNEKESVDSRFSKYGFVQLSNNEQTNFEGREFKTIMVEMHCTYVRFLLHQPHGNRQNFFSQVGLHYINAIGYGLDVLTEPAAAGRYQPQQQNEEIDERSIEDYFIHSKLMVLHQYKEKAVLEYNYDYAKRIKEIINNVKSLGYQIRGLYDKKREAVEHEDYDRAQKLKADIYRIRSSAETVISNVNNLQFRARTVMREEDENEENIGGGLDKSHVSSVRNTVPREGDNEFVEEFREVRKEPTLRINHDDRVLPTHLGKQKTEIREDDPPPETHENVPAEPYALTTQLEKYGAMLLSLFEELTVRQFYSKHWQHRLYSLKTFLNELRSARATKGKDNALLFRVYMNIVSSTLSEKVVQICTHSLQLLQEILLTNQKMHHEARIHYFQGDADNILLEVLKRMNDNNIKIRGLADEIFRKMAESGLYGVLACSNALMKVSGKLSSKQYKSKLDTLIYMIELYGIGNHAVPLSAVDFAVNYAAFQSPEVRNSAIDLLVHASLKGAEDRVQASIYKLDSNVKEMIQKKMKNAQQARYAANKAGDAKNKSPAPKKASKK